MTKIDVQRATLILRKKTVVKVGDTLLFEPSFQATAGESAEWFKKYAGMKAEVIGFGEDGISSFVNSLTAITGGKKGPKIIGRLYVRFENGDEPDPPGSGRTFLTSMILQRAPSGALFVGCQTRIRT